MQELNLPKASLKVTRIDNVLQVWDVVRQKYVVLQPEENVRQHLIHYLNSSLGYPFGLMSVEKQLTHHGKKWRSDLVLYNKLAKPQVLIECKAPDVELSQQTFEQAARYNLVYQVPFLVISNGLKHFCCKVNLEERSFSFFNGIPSFKEINT